MKNMKLNLDLKNILTVVSRYKRIVITLVIIGLMGYTGYQISRITSVQPDAAYLETRRAEAKAVSLKINKATQDKLRGLQSAGDTSVPTVSGKSNPFAF
jgi:hypothetical protein